LKINKPNNHTNINIQSNIEIWQPYALIRAPSTCGIELNSSTSQKYVRVCVRIYVNLYIGNYLCLVCLSIDAWSWVMTWLDMVPHTHMVSMLERSFFSRWLNVLSNWLSSNPDYDEVTKWYMGWKSMFPEQLLIDPTIKGRTVVQYIDTQVLLFVHPSIYLHLYKPNMQ